MDLWRITELEMTSVAELSSTACTGARTASPPCPRPAPPPARRWRARPGCSLAGIGTGRELRRRERDIPELGRREPNKVHPVTAEPRGKGNMFVWGGGRVDRAPHTRHGYQGAPHPLLLL